MEKTYIVTGATGGIGREIVKALLQREVDRIVMAVRNPQRAIDMVKDWEKGKCDLVALPLDLCSFASVDAFIQEFKSKRWNIAALINNAGTMPAKIQITPDGYESAMQVNYLSTRRLTEGLLPMIIPGGAVVFTTSVTRHLGNDKAESVEQAATKHCFMRRFVTYGQSKRLIAAYAHKLAMRQAQNGIRVNCSDPGIADTGMITLGNRAIDFLADKFFRPFISSAAQGAETALMAMDSQDTGCIFTRKSKKNNTL